MKKKVLVTAGVCVLSILLLAGCGGQEAAFRLSHFNGETEDGSYDTDIFYKNDFALYGGDTGVIYVSEEQDPVYGGYYYQYNSSVELMPQSVTHDGVNGIAALGCTRSKDLVDWELCGSLGKGYSTFIASSDWVADRLWSPEVVYHEKDEKYYMYFSALAKSVPASDACEYDTDVEWWELYYLVICSSDSPVGPFTLVTSESYYGNAEAQNLNGKVLTKSNPQINFKYDAGLDAPFATIDAHPYFDDVDSDGDGVNDFYLYYSNVTDKEQTVWGMRMKDMVTPDYSTARMLLRPNYRSVEYIGGEGSSENFKLSNYECKGQFVGSDVLNAADDKSNLLDKADYGEERNLNEAPMMWKKDGRYFLTYSPQNAGNINYQVRQSYSDSPLGEFVKPTLNPATIMGANEANTTILGTGHHYFIEDTDGTLFCVSWPNAAAISDKDATRGRCFALDRIHFYNDPDYGLLMCGGPTTSLQAKPSRSTGLINVAPRAEISATNAEKETLKYLNDEMVVFRSYFEGYEFVANSATTITLKFKQPTAISAILIYNSYDYVYAFKQIDSIVFHLTEKPSWYTAEAFVENACIENLTFNPSYVNMETNKMEQGGAAVASFNEIKVDSIEITVSQKLSGENKEIRISDIVVLGK